LLSASSDEFSVIISDDGEGNCKERKAFGWRRSWWGRRSYLQDRSSRQ